MKRYQFFSGLNDDGVTVTLEQYKYWTVVNMGSNEDGFWMLLVSEERGMDLGPV